MTDACFPRLGALGWGCLERRGKPFSAPCWSDATGCTFSPPPRGLCRAPLRESVLLLPSKRESLCALSTSRAPGSPFPLRATLPQCLFLCPKAAFCLGRFPLPMIPSAAVKWGGATPPSGSPAFVSCCRCLIFASVFPQPLANIKPIQETRTSGPLRPWILWVSPPCSWPLAEGQTWPRPEPACLSPSRSLRTSETSYLNEAFSFYSAIRQRSYYSQVNKEDRSGHASVL